MATIASLPGPRMAWDLLVTYRTTMINFQSSKDFSNQLTGTASEAEKTTFNLLQNAVNVEMGVSVKSETLQIRRKRSIIF